MYKRGTVEVVYIEGRASWIKLYNTSGMRFSERSLSKLGLTSRKPTGLPNRTDALADVCVKH